MTFGDFIKDELSSILLQILCAIILTIYLCSLSLDIGECVLILIAWIVIASLYYFYKYYRTNLIFKKWSSILQSLERKYLLGEMISNYGSFQLELFIQILRSSLKSMTQEVSKVQIEKKEYQELIEKWAHELKAPIASITLVCENNPSELSRKILLQANRLSYNVEQVLYYARLGYMSNDYMIKRVSLEDIIHTAILNNKQLLIQNQFSIEVHTVDSFVYTDTKALVFILGQIINNSAQYRSSSPLLTFRAIDTNHHVYLEIQDNGTGIRESDLGRVFEKGFTGSNGHQRKTSTGIGLYLCKQLCKELGIEITICSAVNKYTCVSLAFQKSIESRAIP